MKGLVPVVGGILIALAVSLAGGCEQKEEEKPAAAPQPNAVTWKLGSLFDLTSPDAATGARYFIEKVARISGGGFKVVPVEAAAQTSPLALFDAVAKGSLDAAWSDASAWFEKIPAAAFFSAVPFGPDTVEFLAWIYHGGGLELWREIYAPHNLMPIPCGANPPEAAGWFRQPVTRLEQFKGLKIRFSGIGGRAMQKLGASVHLLAEGDIFPALERGVLDATRFSIPSIDQKHKFYQVAKHYYFPGWQQQASLFELIVNLDRWKALLPPDKALVEVVCGASIVRSITQAESRQGEVLENLKKQGVQIHYWSATFLSGFKRAYEEVAAELSAKDTDFARVHQSYRLFREGYREWSRLSRLPENFN